MVSSQDRRCGGKAQNDDDRCTCPKASDRTVAHGYDRRNPRGCRVADGGDLNILSTSYRGTANPVSASFAPWRQPLIMIRGGGDPNTAMALKPCPEWARRLGASPQKRIVASWSGSSMAQPNTRLRREHRARAWAPLGSTIPNLEQRRT